MTTPDMQAAIKTLELFNEKNEELRTSSFADAIFDSDSGVTVSFKAGQEIKVERRGPNSDSIKAWATNIRLLISRKDRISFNEIFALYEKLPLEPDQHEGMRERKRQIDTFLNGPMDAFTAVNVEPLKIDGQQPSALEFIKCFLYGDILHLDEKKRTHFVNWRENEVVFAFAQNKYCVLCAQLINVATELMECNDYTIRRLGEWIAIEKSNESS